MVPRAPRAGSSFPHESVESTPPPTRNRRFFSVRLRRYGRCFHNAPCVRVCFCVGVLRPSRRAASWSVLVVACNLEVDTKYGPHSGLSKDNLPTASARPETAATLAARLQRQAHRRRRVRVSYTNDIWPKMSSSGAWHCANNKCHGGTAYDPQRPRRPGQCVRQHHEVDDHGRQALHQPVLDRSRRLVLRLQHRTPVVRHAQMPFPDNTLGSGPMSGTADLATLTTWVQCGAPKN